MGDNEAIDFASMKVPQLRELLKRRGICGSSYNKRDLIQLAEQAVQLYDEKEPDDHDSQTLKRRRVVVNGDSYMLPDPAKIRSWTTDLSSLPSLQSGHVIAYAGN